MIGRGHTFVGGLVAGLVLDKQSLVLAFGCILLGFLLGAGWHYLTAGVRWAWRRLEAPANPNLRRPW